MDKAFSLQPSEIQQSEEIQTDRQRLLAQFGALTLDLETCRTNIAACADRERTVTRGVVQRLGVSEFLSARIEGTNLICRLPDTNPMAVMDSATEAKPLVPVRVNGPERTAQKE